MGRQSCDHPILINVLFPSGIFIPTNSSAHSIFSVSLWPQSQFKPGHPKYPNFLSPVFYCPPYSLLLPLVALLLDGSVLSVVNTDKPGIQSREMLI